MEEKFAKSAYWNFLMWGICSSLGITVSTIIDAVLVGNFIGSDGLAVANIATPVFLFYSLFGLTLGIGANVQIGKKLGSSKIEDANRLFNAQFFLGLGIGLVFLLLAALFRDELIGLLGAKGALLPLAQEYLTVVLFSAPIFVVYHLLAVSVRTDGDPKLAAISAAVVILTNLSLDILFLRVLKWGIVGASAALCIAEALGLAVLLLHFWKKHALLKFRFMLPRMAELKSFVINGFGVGSFFIFQAVIMLFFNAQLISSGTEKGIIHVAIYGVFYTMSMIPFAVFDGAGSAISAVVSIFIGERDAKSTMTVFRQSLCIVSCAGLLITLLFMLSAEEILLFFGLPHAVVLQAIPAFRIFAASLVFTGMNTLVTAFWQVIGRAQLATGFSIIRNLMLMLTVGFLLIPQYGIMGLSITYLCSEALCLLGIGVISIYSSSKRYVAGRYAFSNSIYERYYSIQTESIAQISNDLEQLCEEWAIAPKQAFFINLIMEELLLNIIKFGLKDGSKECYISIKIMNNDGEYIVRVRDNVKTYNPFDSSGDEIDNAAIRLITKKTKYCEYQRKLIFNYLYMVV